MFRILILSLLFNTFLCSCNNSTDRAKVLTVESESGDKTTTLEIPRSLFDSLKFDFNAATNDPEFVKLETSDQNRIGRIDKLIATKKSYVIADYYLANSVFFFDKSGKFLNRVSAVDGQAVPLVFDGMSYDNNKSIVYVHFHNNDESYLNSYTETGEFLGKHKSNGLYFSDFAIMPDSSFAFFMPGDKSKSIVNDYELAFGNREGKTQSVAFSYNSTSTLSNYGYNYNLVTFDDYILYSKSYSKYIYQISNQPIRIFPRFELIERNNDSLFIEIDPKLSDQEIKSLSKLKFRFSGRVVPTQDCFYFEFTKKGDRIGFFYDLKDGHRIGGRPEARVASGDSLKLDYYSYPVSSFEDKFISVMDPNQVASSEKAFSVIRKSSPQFQGPLRTKKLESLLRSVKETDNPILVIYRLSSF